MARGCERRWAGRLEAATIMEDGSAKKKGRLKHTWRRHTSYSRHFVTRMDAGGPGNTALKVETNFSTELSFQRSLAYGTMERRDGKWKCSWCVFFEGRDEKNKRASNWINVTIQPFWMERRRGLFLENGQTKEDSFLWGTSNGLVLYILEWNLYVLDRGICSSRICSRLEDKICVRIVRMNIS